MLVRKVHFDGSGWGKDAFRCRCGDWSFLMMFRAGRPFTPVVFVDDTEISFPFFSEDQPVRITRYGCTFELAALPGRRIGLTGDGWEFERIESRFCACRLREADYIKQESPPPRWLRAACRWLAHGFGLGLLEPWKAGQYTRRSTAAIGGIHRDSSSPTARCILPGEAPHAFSRHGPGAFGFRRLRSKVFSARPPRRRRQALAGVCETLEPRLVLSGTPSFFPTA